MKNILLHEYRIPIKGVKKKVIYHFSDTHLTEYDALSTEEEILQAQKKTEDWLKIRKHFTDRYEEPFGESQCRSASEHFLNLLNESRNGDALVITGDLFDYVSPANIRFFENACRDFAPPMMAVCGNHENSNEIPSGTAVSKMKEPIQKVEWDDLLLLGLDDSKREITQAQYDALKAALEGDKKIIVAMHIPIMVEGNEALLKDAGEYFQLNHPNCPDLNHKFIDLIKANTNKIIAVLCGHLHFKNNTPLFGECVQYVSTQGIAGNINKYIIGE